MHSNITDAEKDRLLWNPSTGVFSGFKRKLGWKREAAEFDGIEQFNFYRDEFAHPEEKVPECIWPFMEEITAFCDVSLISYITSVAKSLSVSHQFSQSPAVEAVVKSVGAPR